MLTKPVRFLIWFRPSERIFRLSVKRRCVSLMHYMTPEEAS